MNQNNTVSWRDYVDRRFEDIETAVNKADAATDNRFAAVNEMRAMLVDSTARYMPRPEFNQAHKNLEQKIESLQKMMWMATGVVLTIQLIVGVVLAVWDHFGK